MSRDLSPREARDRFLSRRKQENTEKTVRSYENRLTRFVQWAEDEGIESMSELTGWDLDEYRADREAADIAPTTLKGQLMTLKQLLDYCASIDVVDNDLPGKVNIPSLSKAEESSDVMLKPEDANALLSYFRNSNTLFGTPRHAFLEVAWHVGARMGGIRALDLRDFNPDRQTLEFRHRPPTLLKNKEDGERVVGISEPVVKALRTYIARERFDKRDEEGREPLFCGRQGRPSDTTFRAWSYMSTFPCHVTQCPHGNRRETCDYARRNHASKCPSSRSPHAIRTGSITWQLLQGLAIETVAGRVNARPETIRRHYYRASEWEEFEELRAEETLKLDIGDFDE
ncbi:tyrosine-type recombinase/integrase [Halopiger xanaduensis]|uniref:Integrase family protein n=1 Tax=Halopiger xanaduensis (strain DSM 18323 / JCM 14033 / SH-6) TaxID=797210 RepID=F8DBU4_HALXS|nr:tyrosine-type recombinase/integrase [Halopiger xanaduensis]AEH38855.1 integrase family protein [Halopiger xanaduensis SH-6]